MKKIVYSFLLLLVVLQLSGCHLYSFTGGNTGDAKTMQISFFRIDTPLADPISGTKFTEKLRDLFTQQTNLSLVKSNGDLQFEGEIVGYRITPMGADASQRAAKNRLTVTVNVRFTNKLIEKDNFEREFSFYEDFPANSNPQGAQLEDMLNLIFERISRDIFNESVAKW